MRPSCVFLSIVKPEPKSSPTTIFDDDSSGATVAKPPRTRMLHFSNANALDAVASSGSVISALDSFFLIVSQ